MDSFSNIKRIMQLRHKEVKNSFEKMTVREWADRDVINPCRGQGDMCVICYIEDELRLREPISHEEWENVKRRHWR